MRRQFLHISVYKCDKCQGPVVAGSTGVRENEISRETDIQELGAVCVSCGHRQSHVTAPGATWEMPPIRWESKKTIVAAPSIAHSSIDITTLRNP
jgi:DNA-directed RNA polymerase subunit RPC12/RpoP